MYRMRVFIIALFLLLAFVWSSHLEADEEVIFAQEDEDNAGYACDNGLYPTYRSGDINSCQYACKGSCSWRS